MKNTLLGCLLSSLLFGSTAMAADSWHVGTNNLFIVDYLNNQGVTCASGLKCPTSQPITLSAIDSYLLGWATSTTGHIGMYREIVDLSKLAPTCASSTCSDNTNWANIDAVMDKYEGYNLYLIFTVGNPVPAWADSYATNQNGQCWLPILTDTTDWTTVKNNISWAVGNYLNHYASTQARKTWMTNRLIVESYNELDAGQSNVSGCNDGGSTNTSLGTPERNAGLTQGISYVLNYYSVPVLNQAMASMAGVYSGYTNPNCNGYTGEQGNFCQYMKDYYTFASVGMPNFHAYITPDTEANMKTSLEGFAAAACSGAGSTQCAGLILGETGWLQYNATNCTSNGFILSDTIRNNIYSDLAGDSTLQSKLWAMLFWDSVQYPTTGYGTCPSWGFLNDSSGTALTAGNNLRTYLETH